MSGRESRNLPCWLVVLGLAATCAVGACDDAQPQQAPIKTGSNVGEWISDLAWPVGVGVPVGLYAFGGERGRVAAKRAANAELLAVMISEALKRVIDEPRPRQPWARDGFPSGHAAGAWALSTILAHEYPQHKEAFYAYALAMTWARRGSRWHTWAQALAGGFIGWLAAKIEIHDRDGLFFHIPEQSTTNFAPEATPASVGQEFGMRLWSIGF